MYIFIVNPASGSGKGRKVWKKVQRKVTKLGIPYRSFYTKGAGHASDLAKQLTELYRDKITALIVIGGDGTVHEVVNGLANHPEVPFSAISAGSGNDFSRGFGLPRRPLAALNQLLRTGRRPRRADVGVYHFIQKKMGKGYFINGLGIGFDGEVAQLTNQSKYKKVLNKVKLGGLAYVISALKLLYRYKTKEVIIQVDHQEHRFDQVWLIAVCNIPYYGGGMKIVPKARPYDGELNICVVNRLKPWQVLLALGSVYFGWHTRLKSVHMLKGKRIQITSAEPMLVHADGEVIGTSPLNVTVEKQSRVIY
jgi:YegS/Rv2252/BmrU family lipid kinase